MTDRRLTCMETFARLDDYLDRELSAEEMRLVREHLEVCAVCASEYRFESRVLEGVRSKLRRLQVPGALVGRVSQMLGEEQKRKPA